MRALLAWFRGLLDECAKAACDYMDSWVMSTHRPIPVGPEPPYVICRLCSTGKRVVPWPCRDHVAAHDRLAARRG